jgi:hypothetical protein
MPSLETQAIQCRSLVGLAERIVADLDDAHRAVEPVSGTKTAGWLIGHLSVTGDFGRKLCGRPPLCPVEWRAKFNPGTQPSRNASDYPAMESLLNMFRSVYLDLSEAALAADAATLAAPNPYPPARDDFPTVREFVAYLLTGHFAYHLGQLAGWRAAAGLGRLPS